MQSIEQDIVGWLAKRPIWQRNMLKRIARRETVDAKFFETLAKQIVSGDVPLEVPELLPQDLERQGSAGKRVQIRSIGQLVGVNALANDQSLTFGLDGLTVVYGDNGSGKSGYARLLKQLSSSRVKDPIHGDAFGESSESEQSAKVHYLVDGALLIHSWPDDDYGELFRINFHDERCGDDYLNNERELTYRPAVMTVLNELVAATDSLRIAFDHLLEENATRSIKFPSFPDGTAAAKFMRDFSQKTTRAELDLACDIAESVKQDLVDLTSEELRLQTTNPTSEKVRLQGLAIYASRLEDHLVKIRTTFGSGAIDAVRDRRREAASLRSSADTVSSETFGLEPLSGVGSETWLALWNAAEQYSISEAYPQSNFPPSGESDFCLLCQQPLGTSAADRLKRFHQFVSNDIGRRAQEAENTASRLVNSISEFEVFTAEVTSSLSEMAKEVPALADDLNRLLELTQVRKSEVLANLQSENGSDYDSRLQAADTLIKSQKETFALHANAIDESSYLGRLGEITKAKVSTEASVQLNQLKKQLVVELERLVERDKIESARTKVDTGSITKFNSELSRRHVSEAMRQRFVDECRSLRVRNLTLADKGGLKGNFLPKPQLDGATRLPKDVLSEGEQTAVGLAGLFTELAFDKTESTLVLDDPVSSMDHTRRQYVAERISELAVRRQVIVFTHDVMFLGELQRASDEQKVKLSEQCIERLGQKTPGIVTGILPWRARQTGERLNHLEQELAKMRKNVDHISTSELERQISEWAGYLSETWERLIRSDIAGKIADRARGEVKPKLFRMLVGITEEDNHDFQTGYGNVSKWALRHIRLRRQITVHLIRTSFR